jgi:hypothetical protein
MGVAAVCPVELRAVPERAVDQVGGTGIVQRVDIGLERPQHRLRRPPEGAENRLTAHHDELVLTSHLRRRSHDVLELHRAHLCDLVQDASALGLTQRAGERGVLAQVVGLLGLVHERAADLGHRPLEQLLPLLGV